MLRPMEPCAPHPVACSPVVAQYLGAQTSDSSGARELGPARKFHDHFFSLLISSTCWAASDGSPGTLNSLPSMVNNSGEIAGVPVHHFGSIIPSSGENVSGGVAMVILVLSSYS